MNIEKLDIGNLTEKDWIELHDFTAELFSELYPKEPPVTLDYSKRVFTGSSESHVREHYVIKDGNKIIADSKLWYIKPSSDTKESDVDNVNIDIRVRREYRRKKLATELLTYLLENEILERHVKVNLSADRSPGYEFCESFDGEITTEGFPCSLWFEQTDWKNIEKMNNQAKNRSEEISVSISEGINAEDEPAYFDIFCDMYEELSKYRKDYSFNREFTKKQMIASRQKEKDRGVKLFIAWAKDENGNLIGISELVNNPNNPARLITALTGVSKEYRNKGLCKRMKTELLLYARENLPEAKYILTSSNSDNTVMLAINQKLGFEFEKPSRGYVYKTEEMKKKLGII